MLTTVPFRSVPGLDTPVTQVMHVGLTALPTTATLGDVASTMRDNRVHGVLIIDADGDPLGWVTSRSVLHNHGREWEDACAVDAITEPVARIGYDATVDEALTAFIASGASRILVTSAQHDAPDGVVAESDLVAFMARRSPHMSATKPRALDSIFAHDVMRAPIIACGPDTALDQVAKLMADHQVHAVIVDGIADGHLVWGVVTDQDLIRAALDDFTPADAGRAATTEPVTVDAGDPLAVVSRLLVEHACSHAVVVDGERPVGVISTLDIACAMAAA